MGARWCKCASTAHAPVQMQDDTISQQTSGLLVPGVSRPVSTAVDPSRYTHAIGKYLFNEGENPLGSGGFGRTFLAVNRDTGEEVALKLAHEAAQHTSAELREVVLQISLQDDSIVPIKDIVYDCIVPRVARGRKQLGVIMEVMRGGELFSEVQSDGGLSEDKARRYFRDILFAMSYCHGRNVCHRDLKLENLLLTADKKTCKVCDFGLAKNVTAESAKTIIGTAKYVAPEVLSGADYDGFKADIWSCGVCLYCMVECRFPFTVGGSDGVGGAGVHRATQQNLRMMRLLKDAEYKLRPGYSPEFIAFLSRLLTPDASARYTAAEALLDPWMLDRDWTVTAVKRQIASMDTRSAPIPGDYTSQRAWVAKVEELCGTAASSEDDSEDDGF